MATFKQIKVQFNKLSAKKQELLLEKIWNYSRDMRLFLCGQLISDTTEKVFIEQMEKATYGKIDRKGAPGMPNGKVINSIITKAKKSNVSIETSLRLEELAYQIFIDFLNKFGGGPENYEDMAGRHLENYLNLIKKYVENESERSQIFEKTRQFLIRRNNLNHDHFDEVFEIVTGIPVNRPSHW